MRQPLAAALDGIRVLEQGTFITGPCAGMMLADLGADVIKLESPAGDPYRAYQGGLFSPHFQAYNRNKRSVALDLGKDGDRALFDELLRGADVYIQNFRPGAAERLGAGAERLMRLNPRLVYGSISGFGARGPYAERPSYDSVAQALSGFLSVVVDPEQPRFMGPALADAITGIYAAYGILAALVARGRDGRGSLVEVSMLEAMAHFAIEPFAAFFALGKAPRFSDRPRLAQAHILRTADGGLIALHLSSLEKFWQELTRALGSPPELLGDARFGSRLSRIEHYEALGATLDALFSRRTLSEWLETLGRHDVPFAPIQGMSQVVEDPQVRELGLIVPVEGAHGGARAVRPAIQWNGERAAAVRSAPLLDEHGALIRELLGRGQGWPAPAVREPEPAPARPPL